jgi:hypothetical protein
LPLRTHSTNLPHEVYNILPKRTGLPARNIRIMGKMGQRVTRHSVEAWHSICHLLTFSSGEDPASKHNSASIGDVRLIANRIAYRNVDRWRRPPDAQTTGWVFSRAKRSWGSLSSLGGLGLRPQQDQQRAKTIWPIRFLHRAFATQTQSCESTLRSMRECTYYRAPDLRYVWEFRAFVRNTLAVEKR